MRYLGAITASLLLTSCSIVIPQKSRTAMVGMPVTDVFACAGKPTSFLRISDDDWILQYEQNQDTQSEKDISYSTLVSLKIGSMGQCHSVFRIHKNYLVSVHFTGPSLTMSGANGACIPLIKECVTRQDHTTLPDNYNLSSYLKDK